MRERWPRWSTSPKELRSAASPLSFETTGCPEFHGAFFLIEEWPGVHGCVLGATRVRTKCPRYLSAVDSTPELCFDGTVISSLSVAISTDSDELTTVSPTACSVPSTEL